MLDLRQLTVTHTQPCDRTPAHLPDGCKALRCSVASSAGATATVILGGPPEGVCPLHRFRRYCAQERRSQSPELHDDRSLPPNLVRAAYADNLAGKVSADDKLAAAPGHLQLNSAMRCAAVLANVSLVEHALRNTMVADALSMQFRLPPTSAPSPTAKSQVRQ